MRRQVLASTHRKIGVDSRRAFGFFYDRERAVIPGEEQGTRHDPPLRHFGAPCEGERFGIFREGVASLRNQDSGGPRQGNTFFGEVVEHEES